MGRYFDKLFPAQKSTTIDIPKVPGFTRLVKKFLPREIPVTGVLSAATPALLKTALDDLAVFLYGNDDTYELIFSDKTDRFYIAEHIETIELGERGRFVPLELQFICYDPFGYAVTATEVNETGITVNGHTWNVANAGKYYAFPIITITFNQSQTHIYIRNNSVAFTRLDITKAFSNTNVLMIDTKTMNITLNNVYSPAGIGDGGDGNGYLPILRVGDNTFEVGTVDGSLNVDVKVTFRKVFL
jgi:predicted phage tail component-like protein